MSLKIYNTLTGKKEEFVPLKPGKVGMYVCGPTVYDTSHIGHARSVVIFDVIFRWFRASGYDVCYVRNFTDVDDKIINKANETGHDPIYISEKYIKEFHNEMDSLNVLRPTIEPKATEHIQDIINFISKLIENKKAYHVEGGDVFFSISSFEGYGKLSGRNPDDMIAGARIAVDENKKNPMDFTLWKPAKEGEPAWESPWGPGRPGWHIECSAMSNRYLGEGFDIHGGGKDLIFPHHENEIAQSEALSGCQFVKYWVHNGFVDINNEKMSKSLGNFTMIKDVLKRYHPEVIRLFLLSKHYRSPIDYNENSMDEVISSLDKIYGFLDRAQKAGVELLLEPCFDFSEDKSSGTKDGNTLYSGAKSSGNVSGGEDFAIFREAMDDDFNSARGMAAVFDCVRKGNKILDDNSESLQNSETLSSSQKEKLETICSDLKKMGEILGIISHDPAEYFRSKKEEGIAMKGIDPAFVDSLVAERTEARKAKNFARADEIRAQLDEMKIVLEDGPGGTTWKFV
ncbi:Cysteine--tRNA ligase [Desulfamplus magnetovallimortis]|uniref:Cysteine--tRNA ligase n=1 Tax=Desulfamplus magnetovallimortis TaxID=1246637 RepID=A0A1W1H7V3_9BACT|nr:cysteine--tRNA ligase [Desulfamplus magnetovallimortis]SLM28561.1 Cysteine--tRNA ligase [Desulfamplus magnetovallimortis]